MAAPLPYYATFLIHCTHINLRTVIHWPIAFPGPFTNGLAPPHPTKPNEVALDTEVTLVDTWKKMIELQKTGKVKTIGVSNFTVEHIKAITKATGVKPVVNQVEAHPLLPQDDLVAYCKAENIHLTAYSPLGNNCALRSLAMSRISSC